MLTSESRIECCTRTLLSFEQTESSVPDRCQTSHSQRAGTSTTSQAIKRSVPYSFRAETQPPMLVATVIGLVLLILQLLNKLSALRMTKHQGSIGLGVGKVATAFVRQHLYDFTAGRIVCVMHVIRRKTILILRFLCGNG